MLFALCLLNPVHEKVMIDKLDRSPASIIIIIFDVKNKSEFAVVTPGFTV
jgi:hypothetical protein